MQNWDLAAPGIYRGDLHVSTSWKTFLWYSKKLDKSTENSFHDAHQLHSLMLIGSWLRCMDVIVNGFRFFENKTYCIDFTKFHIFCQISLCPINICISFPELTVLRIIFFRTVPELFSHSSKHPQAVLIFKKYVHKQVFSQGKCLVSGMELQGPEKFRCVLSAIVTLRIFSDRRDPFCNSSVPNRVPKTH